VEANAFNWSLTDGIALIIVDHLVMLI